MAKIEKTYNTGRVVGWSSYEEFLKETGTDGNAITPFMYQTMVTYGVTRVVELLPGDAWKRSNSGNFYLQTVRVKGASWGAVPVVGLDYEAYMATMTSPQTTIPLQEDTDTAMKTVIEKAVKNIFSVYVSDSKGKKAQSATASHGYLTFIAYPDILDFNEQLAGKTMKLIVRGLSMEDLDVASLYYGPQGLMFAGNGMGESGAKATEYKRALPDTSQSVDLDMNPVIDMRTTDPKTYYGDKFTDAPVALKVDSLLASTGNAGIVSVYGESGETPALYGTRIDNSQIGNTKAYPLDIVAPGTVKLYHLSDSITEEVAQEMVRQLEDRPYNYGLYRDNGNFVIYQYDKDPLLENHFIPVSDDKVIDISGIRSCNTRYIWMFRMGAGGGAATYEDMQDVRTAIMGQGTVGQFSQAFLDTYGIDLNRLNSVIDAFKDGAGIEFISGYYSTIDPSDYDKYYAILASPFDSFDEGSQQISCILVSKETGAVSRLAWESFTFEGITQGINFAKDASATVSDRQYKQALVDYLGSWWGKNGDEDDADHVPVYRDHPTAKESIKEYNTFYQPSANMPNPPAKYDRDWYTWSQTTTIKDVLQLSGQTVDELGIHKDYQNLTLNTFLVKAAYRDLSKPDDDLNIRAGSGAVSGYLFPASQCPNSSTDTLHLRATCRYIYPGTSKDFYGSRYWKFFEYNWTNDTGSIGEDITETTNRSDSSIAVAEGHSGHHTTQSLSMADSEGVLFQLAGTGAVTQVDYITWDTLVNALNHNKKIDVLGDAMRSLKNKTISGAGPDYIEFASGIRLYVSPTAPTGTAEDPIPDGSIGIGW